MEQSKITGGIGGAAKGASTGFAMGGPAGAVVGGIAGGIAGFLSGGGENQAMNTARMNASIARLEGEENERRLRVNMEQELGQAKTQIATSNLMFTGSPRSYYNALESTFLSDVAYNRLQTSLRERISMNAGQAAVSTIRAGGIGSMLSGATALASSGLKLPTRAGGAGKGLGDVSGWKAADTGG